MSLLLIFGGCAITLGVLLLAGSIAGGNPYDN